MKKQLLLVGLILSVFLISFVSAQPIIEPEIEELLQNQNEVRVVIFINDSESENLNEVKLEILSSLTESEFELKVNLEDTEWFAGELTSAGLEKLRLNNNILKINKDRIGETIEDNETEEQEEINDEIEVEKKSNLWLWIIIGVILIIILFVIIKGIGNRY